MTNPSLHRLLLATALLAVAGTAQAADYWGGNDWGVETGLRQGYSYQPNENIKFDASLGMMYLRGDEKVLSGNYTVSHLIWESRAPVLRGSVDVNFGNGISGRLEGSIAGYGTSYMEDYDWLQGDDTFENWSHRSQHDDTSIDHYFTGAAMLGYELVRDPKTVIRVHGGFKYTDVQWSARGGTYVYSSSGGFRDQTGAFADGEPGITYRQQLPELFLGFDGEERYGNIRLGGMLRGGMTFLAKATDHHWMRDLRFDDELWVAPTIALGADVGYALGPNAELFVGARFDHVFVQTGDTKMYDIPTGTQVGSSSAGAAGGLTSAELNVGLKATF